MTTMQVEQVVAAPERVWAAWTTAEGLAGWWWPQLSGTTYDVDARVGGEYLIRSETAGIGVRGSFDRVDEPRELGFTWVWLDGTDELPADRVTVSLADPGDGTTRVVVRHAMTSAADGGTAYREGWRDVLARLATSYDG